MKGYLSAFPGPRSKDSFVIPSYCICSNTISASEIVDAGLVSESVSKKLKKLAKRKKRANEILKRFNLNYQQMKLAVDLKVVADELLPKKAQIVDANNAGDKQALKAMLDPYLTLIRKYRGVGNLRFDREIEDIAVSLM